MPLKMVYKDEEGNTYLVINPNLLYALLILNILVIILIIFLGLKIQFWFGMR